MSVYLSRLLLNCLSRQVRSELAHPYEMHRTLVRGFERHLSESDVSGREKCGMLFRADVDEQGHQVIVYVQSILEPDWRCLEGLDGYLFASQGEPGAVYKDISRAYALLQDSQTLSFRLRANPTKRIGRGAGEGMAGKRVGLVREEEQTAWLERKGRTGGFALLSSGQTGGLVESRQPLAVEVRTEGKQTGRKRDHTHAHTMTHLSVLFDGRLRITDAEAFRETLLRGIGSAKAYGFGLLSIAPPGRP